MNEGPEVAVLVHSFAGGGAERVAVLLANQMAGAGITVELVVQWADGPYLLEVSPLVRVVELACRMRSLPISLRKYLRTRSPVVMLSFLTSFNVVAALVRLRASPKRLVVSEHSALVASSGMLQWWERLLIAMAPRAYRRCDLVVAVSEGLAQELVSLGVPAGLVTSIPNPIDVVRIRSESMTHVNHPFFDTGVPVVIAAGRLERRKDYGTLLRAAALLKERRDFRLLILGEGEERERLSALVARLDLRSIVDMPGFQSPPWPWIARSDVVALSSSAEGWPLVLAESLALGKTIVATDCPTGPAEILDRGRYGTLVPVGDPVAMAKAIESAIVSPIDPARLRSQADEWSVDVVAKRYWQALGIGREASLG